MRISLVFAFACLILGFLAALARVADGLAASPLVVMSDLPDADRVAFAARFEREIWPLMTQPADPQKGCLGCHGDDESNTSPFVLSGDPGKDFATLLADGYFDRGNPASILSKVAHKKPKYRMPPEPAEPWSKEEVGALRKFVAAMAAKGDRTSR
jgi:hypothetical protein